MLYRIADLCRNNVKEGQLRTVKGDYVQRIRTFAEERYMYVVDTDQMVYGKLRNLFKCLSDCRINEAKLLFRIDSEREMNEESRPFGFKQFTEHLPCCSRLFKQIQGRHENVHQIDIM